MNTPASRLSMGQIWDEVRAEFFSLDRGFARTVWLMVTRPGRTVAEVWRGEQPTLTRPLRYFLIVFSIYAVVFIASGAMEVMTRDMDVRVLDGINRSLASAGRPPITIEQAREANPLGFQLVSPLVGEFFNLGLLFLAALAAFARSGINTAERLSMSLYVYGTFNLVQMPFVLLVLTGRHREFISVPIYVLLGYLMWTAATLREPRHRFAAWRGVLWWVMLNLLAAAFMYALIARMDYRLRREPTVPVVTLSPGSVPASTVAPRSS